MICNFDANKCPIECKKYPICSYFSIQNQFIEVQSQLNFIYTTITQILQSNETNEIKLSLLENAVRSKIESKNCDEEMTILNEKKESGENEKENK